jgi:hypothetical protein
MTSVVSSLQVKTHDILDLHTQPHKKFLLVIFEIGSYKNLVDFFLIFYCPIFCVLDVDVV